MNNKVFGLTGGLLLIISAFNHCFATDKNARKPPRAVLVQLRSEQNRINAMKRAHDNKGLRQVEADAAGVASAMKADFTDHLNYCPVYYFEDTNLDLIKSHHFNGVLLNADGTPAKTLSVDESTDDYLIVYYGHPVMQQRGHPVAQEADPNERTTDQPSGIGLIVNNAQYQQITFFYRLGLDYLWKRKRQKAYGKYAYESKRFEMEYYPFAAKLNDYLRAGQKDIPISHGSEPKAE